MSDNLQHALERHRRRCYMERPTKRKKRIAADAGLAASAAQALR
jgi:hypothetical protein